MELDSVRPQCEPWTKVKLVGQKAPLKVQTFGRSAFAFKCRIGYGSLPFSTSALIASSADATWCVCAFAMFATGTALRRERW